MYERYADRVYSYLRARSTDDEDAADLTQQVFLKALDALPRYRAGRVPFAAWLFRIARNVAIDFHRRRRHTVAWDSIPEALHPACDGDGPARLERQEMADESGRAFADLAPDAREILVLRFGADLTVAEIAAVIGKSPAATRMRLIRALRTLKEHYDDIQP